MPQWFFLYPLLFSIYINDFVTINNILKFVMYADDTTMYVNIEDFPITNLASDITNELDNIHVWLKHNKMSLNVEKTQMHDFSHQSEKTLNVTVLN